ncbi:MAG: CsgG/HfaB family protein [Spirochaetia bacterium]|nr:CsgG/HfaB family protein [Spirochaetia bacterium]
MYKIKKNLFLFMLTIVSGSLFAKPRLAVFDLSVSGVEESVGQAASAQITEALLETGHYVILERGDLEKVLSEQQLAQSGILSEDKAAELGKMAGAEIVVTGSVSKLESGIQISARLIKVQTGEVEKSAAVIIESDSQLREAADEIAAKFTKGSSSRKADEKLVNRNVLILSFVNLKKNENFDYLRESIGEALIGPLKETGSFELIGFDEGKSAAKKLKISQNNLHSETNAAKIGETAQADVVVCGSFIVIGDAMQITAKAIETKSGRVSVSKSVQGKTDSSMFSSIDELGQSMSAAMEKELPPIPQKFIIRQAKKKWYEETLSFGLYANLSMPVSKSGEAFASAFAFQGDLEYIFLNFGGINSAFAVEGGFSKYPKAENRFEENTLTVFYAAGGLNFSYAMGFHNAISVHLKLLPGLAFSTLDSYLYDKQIESRDIMLSAAFESRYRIIDFVSAAVSGSYHLVLYKGTPLTEGVFSGGLRYNF